jgi:CRISPR-associated protein Cmr2
MRVRFLAVWRLLKVRLIENVSGIFEDIPADTRTPDHSIWNHLDIVAGLKAAESSGKGTALLAFALGPVQRFIEASRSVRDLWSGSMILSWLAFRSLLPIIEELGPAAFIYPSLRGNPLVDLWLRNQAGLHESVILPTPDLRMTPCLPHRFLAVVPWGENGAAANELADCCRKSAHLAWREIADAVRRELTPVMGGTCPDWDKRWNSQVDEYFQAHVAVTPLGGAGDMVDRRLSNLLSGQNSFANAFTSAQAIREMAGAIPAAEQTEYPQDHAGRWQYQVELATRSLAAQRAIHSAPVSAHRSTMGEHVPQKCSLLGSFEQMGPDDLAQSRTFWERAAQEVSVDGVRIRSGEALSAVALVKRFAAPAFLRQQLELQQSDLRFPDTYTVAAAEWLNRAGIDPSLVRQVHREWNGQWLGWNSSRDNSDEPECPASVLEQIKAARRQHGPAPAYYTILKLDGDDLGGWLRGERSPIVREVMHPDLVSYYDKLGDTAKAGLDARRPVGPALHAAISTALANFALHAVPAIVAEHRGTTIYSAGDDALILLPTSTALVCALELHLAYTSDWYSDDGREYMMMGSRATISGGMVVVHAKDDLRLALQDARAAEEETKLAGKDALCIRVRRRSGEHTSALCPWPFVPTVADWVRRFQDGASDRWAYHLYAQRPTLGQLPVPAMQAEIRRQISRSDEPTPTLIAPERLAGAFDELHAAEVAQPDGARRRRFRTDREALDAFLTLCHTASFLARGRDQ